MAGYFQLISKETKTAEPFVVVDEKLCAHLGVPVDPEKYLRGWYDAFGLTWAMCGAEEGTKILLEGYANSPKAKEMLDWILEHYTVKAWHGR